MPLDLCDLLEVSEQCKVVLGPPELCGVVLGTYLSSVRWCLKPLDQYKIVFGIP